MMMLDCCKLVVDVQMFGYELRKLPDPFVIEGIEKIPPCVFCSYDLSLNNMVQIFNEKQQWITNKYQNIIEAK